MNAKEIIARRASKELENGTIVNLGIGLPTMVSNYVPEGVDVIFQSENGFLGVGPNPTEDEIDKNLTNAGAQPTTMVNGGMYFDSSYSFALIRGGHVNATILGALQVDEKGNLANWMIPGKMVPGMGGAMDLVTGAKKVIVTMQHTAKGNPKIFTKCSLPLTGVQVVDMIITELCVLKVTEEGLLLTEVAEGVTAEDVQKNTEAKVIVAEDLKIMDI